jgi:hypothetical protein
MLGKVNYVSEELETADLIAWNQRLKELIWVA